MNSKVIFKDTTKCIDTVTGEIVNIETRKRERITIPTDSFYMVFIDYLAPLFKVTNGTTKNVLEMLCCRAEYNTGMVSLSMYDRAYIMDTLGIKKSTLSMSIRELVDKGLISGERGRYRINPRIFWKGDSLTRRAVLDTTELNIEFSVDPESIGLKPIDEK